MQLCVLVYVCLCELVCVGAIVCAYILQPIGDEAGVAAFEEESIFRVCENLKHPIAILGGDFLGFILALLFEDQEQLGRGVGVEGEGFVDAALDARVGGYESGHLPVRAVK
jgi:hypothetical protein